MPTHSLTEHTAVFLFDEKGQLGPMPLKKARTLWEKGEIDEIAYYWYEGMAEWQPLIQLWGPMAEIVPFVDPSHPITFKVEDAGFSKPAPYRVLIVDDDLLMREMIGDLLDHEGITWEKADDIQPAIRLLEKTGLDSFDAILTDYQTAGGSGIDLVHWIKQRENALQILLLSAKDDKEVIKSGLRAGVLDFLEKPLRKKTLLPAVKSAIEKTRRQREERSAYLDLIRDKLTGRGEAVESLITGLIHRESSVGALPAKLETVIKYSDELEKRNTLPGETAIHEAVMPFQGQIVDLSLLDLIQLLSQSGKSGELQILGSRKTLLGSIYLAGGRLVHSEQGKLEGRAALAVLIEQVDGYFCFHYGRQAPDKTLFEDTVSLLLSLSADMDRKDKTMAA